VYQCHGDRSLADRRGNPFDVPAADISSYELRQVAGPASIVTTKNGMTPPPGGMESNSCRELKQQPRTLCTISVRSWQG
jgi:hypothetical protein